LRLTITNNLTVCGIGKWSRMRVESSAITVVLDAAKKFCRLRSRIGRRYGSGVDIDCLAVEVDGRPLDRRSRGREGLRNWSRSCKGEREEGQGGKTE
jgi:hypothetical protein